MRVLAVNVGSSSLKLDVWGADLVRPFIKLEVRGIAGDRGGLVENGAVVERKVFADHAAALAALLQRVPELERIARVGHRVVHGGSRYRGTTRVDETVLRDLEELVPLSPLHQVPMLAVMRACRGFFPAVPHAAVFDTAFHSAMPPRAYTYAIPAAWREAGVRRYGFHGIACADIVAQLGGELRERAIILHLGAGCSATALLKGKSIDTTMGFTPLEGLIMATRSGDIDPGALLFAQRNLALTPQKVEYVLNSESGLLALSGSADMRDLLRRRDDEAVSAVEVFCYRAAKAVGALTVALGGLEQLIFSGGIGEHAAAVRAGIGALVAGLGVSIDADANNADAPIISAPAGAVRVDIIAVDEGRQIARDTMALSLA